MTVPEDKYPQSPRVEGALLLNQATVGSVPVLGAAASAFVASAIGAPLAKRRVEWFNRLGSRLEALERQIGRLDPVSLGENEQFVSIVAEVTDAAMKSSTEEKRERLANVVLNIVAGQRIEEALLGRFIGYVARFSEPHILLLRVCENPRVYPRIVERNKNMVSVATKLGELRVELNHHGISSAVIDAVVDELEGERLIRPDLKKGGSGSTVLESHITPVGKAFLGFIESPLQSGD